MTYRAVEVAAQLLPPLGAEAGCRRFLRLRLATDDATFFAVAGTKSHSIIVLRGELGRGDAPDVSDGPPDSARSRTWLTVEIRMRGGALWLQRAAPLCGHAHEIVEVVYVEV